MPTGPAPGRSELLLGIVFYALAMALFVSMDTIAKHVLETQPIVAVVWVRFSVHFMLLWAFAPRPRLSKLRTQRFALHLVRSASWISITFLFYIGLGFVPLAESIILINTAPFMVALLAGPVLGEAMNRARWSAVLIGFLGALIVLRPGLGALHWGAIFPLLAAAGFAIVQFVTRTLSLREDSWTTLLYTAGIGAVALSPFGLYFLDASGSTPWHLLLALGALAAVGDIAVLASFKRAPTTTLAPFQYTQIIWAMLSGVLVFNEMPDRLSMVGAAIIVAGGLVLWRRSG